MKNTTFSIIIILIAINLNAQIIIKSGENVTLADLRVCIGENVTWADMRVQIGKNVTLADFTVGIIDQKIQADFIVTNGFNYDLSVQAGDNVTLADIRIQAGGNVTLSDVRVKVKTSGTVDYFVYIEKEIMTMNDIVIALLPALNKEMDYKFEKIPKIN